jgi:hypothetical protein
MNMERRIPRPAAPALKFISFEDGFAVAGEVIPGSRRPRGGTSSKSGDGGDSLAAGAEERLLPGTRLPASPQEAFPAGAEG